MLRQLRPGICYVLRGASRRMAMRASRASLEHFGMICKPSTFGSYMWQQTTFIYQGLISLYCAKYEAG